MKTQNPILKTMTIALLAGLGLAGCVAVPVYDGPRGYGPRPVVVVPVVRPYYGHGGYRGGHRDW